jgi:hypothetical protein
VSLNASFNEQEVVQLEGIMADASGEVVIAVSKASSARYGFLGAMVIEQQEIPVPVNTNVEILASGVTGDEQMSLRIGGIEVQKWSNIGTGAKEGVFRSFSYQHDQQINSVSDIQVVYLGGAALSSDLRVDKIIVDGVTYETEAPDTYSTGTWDKNTGVEPGYKESEWLHSKGYFHFQHKDAIVQNQENLRTTSTDKEFSMTYQSFNMYPNPFVDQFTIQVPEYKEITKVQLLDLIGTVVYSEALKSTDGKVVVNLGNLSIAEGKYAVLIYTTQGEVIKSSIMKKEQF